ncbi:hypothetical protein A1O1_07081 [Capronia coronata CBS 617.96]|uniref:RING-type domain-containing protein n=1 Tax=Capronia coronata CBS 617.96 TaxID=1182541 RepID=W9XTC1_9EURO|nr:uncharacterized protein A1O1_07081 [Capronia coronata CBS 617.96]EXJ83458.1 hypothetical protein A1O1_07081 [Capronia coronata CBS 617.96]
MATSTLDPSLTAIVKTLDWEKVPDKLHCASCHQFNLNAYKSTCCDGYICESCFNKALDVSCPVCDHKPFTSDVCKPNKAMRNTIKAYLKTVEKTRVDERAKSATTEETPIPHNTVDENGNRDGQEEVSPATATATGDQPQLVETTETDGTPAVDVQPSIEDPDPDSADLDDDVDIQVDIEDDHREISTQRVTNVEETPRDQPVSVSEQGADSQDPSNNPEGMSGMDFQNMMTGFSNMDYNQMMQMMAANGMAGFNPMMGMPMGMNPMSAGMFGGFGGPNGGMNGMNMGMNFTPNQGMFSGWNNGQPNNNMWQNNNANAFSNGMGGDFGSNYGFNMAPNGNFQPSYPNGDFQSGYYGRGPGRGRGRGRGGYGRGRGNFHQFSQYHQQGHPNGFDQRQYDSQTSQSQNPESRSYDAAAASRPKNDLAETNHEDDEFAPGGQEEVLEALGDDYQKSSAGDEKPSVDSAAAPQNEGAEGKEPEKTDQDPPEMQTKGVAAQDEVAGVHSTGPIRDVQGADQDKPIPEAYSEDLHVPMPPPSAPLGPSAQYGEHVKDYGFRSRGQHGRFPSRGQGATAISNGHPASPVRPAVQAPSEPKGVGVLGAPTGPRAMREPVVPARPVSQPASTGFQIMGRASRPSQRSESREIERTHSRTPTHDYEGSRDRDVSRRPSRQDRHDRGRGEVDKADEAIHRDKDKQYRTSTKQQDSRDDYDREDREGSHSRSASADRRPSRRSRGDKEKLLSSWAKQEAGQSRRYREEEPANGDGDHQMEDYDDSIRSNRDGQDGESKSKHHRSGKSSRYDDRDRDRDRERDRRREKDRERDKDRYRDKDRDSDRVRDERYRDRDRKRSRHDRHREDDKHHDYDYDYEHGHGHGHNQDHEADDPDSRHRSRRHKRDHRRAEDQASAAVSMSVSSATLNGRSHNTHHRSSTATAGSMAPSAAAEAEKDPHTLEREARNRERMLKEQQRREKAAKANVSASASASGPGSGGAGGTASSRRIMYKYEDELERGLAEGERAGSRWR